MPLVKPIKAILDLIVGSGSWAADVPMAPWTTFRVGGNADFMVTPKTKEEARVLFRTAHEEGWDFFVLGRGANILVSDRGIRGLVINMTELNRLSTEPGVLCAEAGADVSRTVEFSLEHGLSSLEFLYGMPSTIGGAVWMNARCYGSEISEKFLSATIVSRDGSLSERPFRSEEWRYKVSPFQSPGILILEARFAAGEADRQAIRTVMEANHADRSSKGHFRAPCAGSVFKNNHAFGSPSGVLIDRAGLKGLRLGGAQVSDWHGNIIINAGGATASDIRALTQEVKRRVLENSGFLLEEEVLYVGEWIA